MTWQGSDKGFHLALALRRNSLLFKGIAGIVNSGSQKFSFSGRPASLDGSINQSATGGYS